MPGCHLVRSSSPHARRSGFTLVELLVVIGIIAVLISILIPAISAGRAQAKNIGCQTNLRNLMTACLQFSNDNRGAIPSPSRREDSAADPDVAAKCIWAMKEAGIADLKVGVIWKYVADTEENRKLAIWCPADNQELQISAGGKPSTNRNFSYSLNSNLLVLSGSARVWVLRRSIKDPALKIMFYEEVGPNDCYYTNGGDDDRPTGRHGKVGSLQYGTVEYDTAGRCNAGFFDGHVETMNPAEVKKTEYHTNIK
jgi:prepilin-type N-terminal cleavage/methylation domain-containing protein/prepilin-type processing-associated H-X9-DG protein